MKTLQKILFRNRTPVLITGAVLMLLLVPASFCSAEFTFEDEMKLGRELYEKLEAGDQLSKDPRVSSYINDLGRKILNQSNKPVPYDFKFSVVKSGAINAFATPGGFIYVNEGTIILAEDECEIAGVIAHEIAHVNCRHIAQMVEKSKKINFATMAAVLAGAILGGGGAGAQAAIGLSLATATTLSLKYSRENEEEADRMGMQYLVSAGYDPKGMLDFMKIMKNYEFYSSNVPSYFLTHPGTEDRIRYLDGLIHVKYTQKGADDFFGKLGRVQALLVLGEKEPGPALKYFQKKLESSPDNTDALYGASVALARLGKTDEAAASFNRVLKADPNDIDALREYGIMYFNMRRMKEAESCLKKAYAVNDGDAQTILYLGKCYEDSGRFREALELYSKYQQRNARDTNIYYNLAMMYGRTGDEGMSHYNFGIFFKKKGKQDSAIFHFQSALKSFPPDSDKYAEISSELEQLKKARKAPPRPNGGRPPSGRKSG
ncbi:MAG: M48 family metalloprotease [Syntrophaceae bacterium]